MFWNGFFEGAVLMCTYALKWIFWGSSFNVYLCSEMHFLREQLFSFLDLWFLISVVAALCFFVKVLTSNKTFPVLTCVNTNLRLIANWLQSSGYVGRDTSLEWLPPLGKSSASLGRGLGERHLVTNGVAWRPVSHTGAAQWVVGSQRWPEKLCDKKEANQKTGCSGNQSNSKSCLSIRFLLREFCKD